MLLRKSIFLPLTVLFLTVIALLLTWFYLFQSIPAETKTLKSSLFDRAKTIFALTKKPLVKSIEGRDDLTLLSQVETVAGLDDVSTAFVIDHTGTVLTHNKTAEWGKTYDDDFTREALKNRSVVIRKTDTPVPGYLFSLPLTSSATFVLGMSTQKMSETLSTAKTQALYTALIALLFSTGLCISFIAFRLAPRFTRLEQLLSSLTAGTRAPIPLTGNDEVGRIASLVNEVMKTMETTSRPNESTAKLHILINELSRRVTEGVVVIDAENRIVCMNRKAGNHLSVDAKESIGKHIIDVINRQELLALIKEATANAGKVAEAKIDSTILKAVSPLTPDHVNSGTVLIIS